jgi:hypothetical protein
MLGDVTVCSEKMATLGEKSFCVLKYHTSKSVVTVQRVFCAKYAKDPTTDKTIHVWCKQFTETGCLCKQKSSGHPLTTEDDVEQVWTSFLHIPKISSCQKKIFLIFPVAVSNSIKVRTLVFLL